MKKANIIKALEEVIKSDYSNEELTFENTLSIISEPTIKTQLDSFFKGKETISIEELNKLTVNDKVKQLLEVYLSTNGINIADDELENSDIDDVKKDIKLLKEKGYLNDEETALTYKAIETKDGKEKEIDLLSAMEKNDQNIKIVERSEQEKTNMVFITLPMKVDTSVGMTSAVNFIGSMGLVLKSFQ